MQHTIELGGAEVYIEGKRIGVASSMVMEINGPPLIDPVTPILACHTWTGELTNVRFNYPLNPAMPHENRHARRVRWAKLRRRVRQ